MRFTRRAFAGCTKPCMRKWRLRLFDFLVSRWLLNALYLRILPVPVTLNVFLALECVFIFGMVSEIWTAKVSKYLYWMTKNADFYFLCLKTPKNNIPALSRPNMPN